MFLTSKNVWHERPCGHLTFVSELKTTGVFLLVGAHATVFYPLLSFFIVFFFRLILILSNILTTTWSFDYSLFFFDIFCLKFLWLGRSNFIFQSLGILCVTSENNMFVLFRYIWILFAVILRFYWYVHGFSPLPEFGGGFSKGWVPDFGFIGF